MSEPWVSERKYKYGCPFCRASYESMFFLKQHIQLLHPEKFDSWLEVNKAVITRQEDEDAVIQQIVENCKFWVSTICKEETMLKYARLKHVETPELILEDLIRRGVAHRPKRGYVGLTEPEKYGLAGEGDSPSSPNPGEDKPPEKTDFEKLRKHFKEETSKLDNWIYHRRITEYFEPPESEEAAKLKKELLERLSKTTEEIEKGAAP